MVLNRKRGDLGWTLYDDDGETLEQRSCECPNPGSVQGQTGWGFQPTNLVKDVPAHGGGLRLDDL